MTLASTSSHPLDSQFPVPGSRLPAPGSRASAVAERCRRRPLSADHVSRNEIGRPPHA